MGTSESCRRIIPGQREHSVFAMREIGAGMGSGKAGRFLFLCFALFCCAMNQWALATDYISPEERVLHIFTWEDYFDSNVISEFQKKYDCIVSIDTYESNDAIHGAISKLPGSYDIVTPSSAVAQVLHREGFLLELDHSRLPNLKYIDHNAPTLIKDPEMRYSVPYTQTVTGVGYAQTMVPATLLGSWNIFNNPGLKSRIGLLDDMREVLGAGLKYLGYSINSTDKAEIQKAGELVKHWMENGAVFDYVKGIKGLEDGELYVLQSYSGDVAHMMTVNPDLGFFVPKEGTAFNSDDFVICADTPLVDLAYAFINYMLDPENAKTNMETILYYMPNKAALELLGPDHPFNNHPAYNIPEQTLEKCEVILDVGEATRIYQEVWETITGISR